MTDIFTVADIADRLYDLQDQIRLLQEREQELSQELAAGLLALRTEEDPMPAITGKYGQKFQLAKKRASYVYNLPQQEYERLGIIQACTPVAGPKMTNTKMKELMKLGRVTHNDVNHWMNQGWYQVDDSGEMTIRQVQTDTQTLKQAVGL